MPGLILKWYWAALAQYHKLKIRNNSNRFLNQCCFTKTLFLIDFVEQVILKQKNDYF